ncbi:MAG: EamA family transporter [Chloroflexi bacterium]|nr:EamA family transporter [Chloroflexota bacterium]MBE3114031.1 EamA family transporter [Actinomycetota bacterium]
MSLGSSILLILFSISIAVAGQIILKIGINHIGVVNFSNLDALKQLFFGVIKSPLVISGLFLYVISAAIWLVVLSAVDLSFAYPFIGFTYVMVLVLSKFILKEDVNPIRWAGALIVTMGVIVISRG